MEDPQERPHLRSGYISRPSCGNDREQLITIAGCGGTYEAGSAEPLCEVLSVRCRACAFQEPPEVLQQCVSAQLGDDREPIRRC